MPLLEDRINSDVSFLSPGRWVVWVRDGKEIGLRMDVHLGC
jgi:hypothetical protein